MSWLPFLWALTALFCLRVIGQPLAVWAPMPGLPPFDAWHSGALPYPVLLGTQLVIVGWLVRTTHAVGSATVRWRRRVGGWLLAASCLYGAAMAARLVLGATILRDVPWFARPIPTVFHLGLATYLGIYGRLHLRYGPPTDAGCECTMPSFHYPAVVALAFGQFALLRGAGASLGVSTYSSIVSAALAVALLEYWYPSRAEWQPERDDLRTDFSFLVAVQLALPPLVGLIFTSLLVSPARTLDLPLTRLWPHQWPLAFQAVAMIASVDFMRYWLHRLAHQHDVLWRLHAVHHSVDRLYWLNTARFHPLEKALQMCLDSLPFLLLGVQPEVLSLYYLAYSTNGFFQHSNIDLRYGVLNYVVSSAEAHRWHHSREPREANSNYGSTTIVWDLLFGTFSLPERRQVAVLGLHDRSFPRSFWGQLRAPFEHH